MSPWPKPKSAITREFHVCHETRELIACMACIDEEVAREAENILPLSDNIYLSVHVTCQVEPHTFMLDYGL